MIQDDIQTILNAASGSLPGPSVTPSTADTSTVATLPPVAAAILPSQQQITPIAPTSITPLAPPTASSITPSQVINTAPVVGPPSPTNDTAVALMAQSSGSQNMPVPLALTPTASGSLASGSMPPEFQGQTNQFNNLMDQVRSLMVIDPNTGVINPTNSAKAQVLLNQAKSVADSMSTYATNAGLTANSEFQSANKQLLDDYTTKLGAMDADEAHAKQKFIDDSNQAHQAIQDNLKYVQSYKTDPWAWFTDKSLGGKIAILLGLAATGVGINAAVQKSPNPIDRQYGTLDALGAIMNTLNGAIQISVNDQMRHLQNVESNSKDILTQQASNISAFDSLTMQERQARINATDAARTAMQVATAKYSDPASQAAGAQAQATLYQQELKDITTQITEAQNNSRLSTQFGQQLNQQQAVSQETHRHNLVTEAKQQEQLDLEQSLKQVNTIGQRYGFTTPLQPEDSKQLEQLDKVDRLAAGAQQLTTILGAPGTPLNQAQLTTARGQLVESLSQLAIQSVKADLGSRPPVQVMNEVLAPLGVNLKSTTDLTDQLSNIVNSGNVQKINAAIGQIRRGNQSNMVSYANPDQVQTGTSYNDNIAHEQYKQLRYNQLRNAGKSADEAAIIMKSEGY